MGIAVSKSRMERYPVGKTIPRYHVYPVNDLREHVTDGRPCWCNPEIDEDAHVVIHHSLDDREQFETGERKPC